MQLVGRECVICKAKVMMEVDATACATCKHVFHNRCLAKARRAAGGRCPDCHQPWQRLEDTFVLSIQCPKCFRRHGTAEHSCIYCGANCAWESEEDLAEAISDARTTGAEGIGAATVTLAIGGICTLIGFSGLIVAFLVLNRGIMFLAALVATAGGATLAQGSRRLVKAKQQLGFH